MLPVGLVGWFLFCPGGLQDAGSQTRCVRHAASQAAPAARRGSEHVVVDRVGRGKETLDRHAQFQRWHPDGDLPDLAGVVSFVKLGDVICQIGHNKDVVDPRCDARQVGHKRPLGRLARVEVDWIGELADPDIVNLVNLRFLSEHYGHSPDEIIRMRSEGEGFAKINAKVKKAKQNQKKKITAAKSAKAKSVGKTKEKKK